MYGYDWYGYDVYGYDRDGYDWYGYDMYGYDRDGYDEWGYDEYGYDRDGYDEWGYDEWGYDIDGYDMFGYDEYGYDRDGYDWFGYDEDGYDEYGCDIDGYDWYGYPCDCDADYDPYDDYWEYYGGYDDFADYDGYSMAMADRSSNKKENNSNNKGHNLNEVTDNKVAKSKIQLEAWLIHSKLNSTRANFIGGNAVHQINSNWTVGLGGYTLITQPNYFNINQKAGKPDELKMSYGGLMLGYKLFNNNVIHGTLNTLIGAGGISNSYFTKGYKEYKNQSIERLRGNVENSAFFVAQPSVNVDVNLSQNFSIGIGGGYRYITGNRLKGISNIKAPTLNLSLKLGLLKK